MFRVALLLAVSTWMCLGGSGALTCHCLNGDTCNPVDGSCPAGCDKGWYGPGCQIGNIALNKPALQSSTYGQYTADNAVNGITPPLGDNTEWNCSHTAEITAGFLWWYVTLSESEDFVIKNVTIVNRQGSNGQHLRNFYILYTSNMIAPPDPTLWARCAFQSSTQNATVNTYTCENRTAIGRRVAVYLIAGSQLKSTDKLILCEVFVDGYSYNATSMLQLRNTYVTTGCDNFQLNFSALSIVPPTYLVVHLVNNTTGNVTLIERIQNNRSGFGSVTVHAMANRTYIVFVAPETCCIGSRCLESGILDNSKCVIGQSTPLPLVTTPLYRQCTADFSKFIISETITCNSITLVIEYITALWDLAPSFIEFHLSTTEINDTKVTRVPAQNKPDTISATFLVTSNSSYSVWAVPVTYWGNTQSKDDLNGSCENSRNCLVGERTPVKVITTLRRQNILKIKGCCASIADVSSEQCESPVSLNITCINDANEELSSANGSFCGLKANTTYTCTYTVLLGSGIEESYSHVWKSVNVTECSSLEEPSNEEPNYGQSTSAAIGGAVSGLAILVTLVTLLSIFQRRRKALKNRKASSELHCVGKREAEFVIAYGNLGAPEDSVYENRVDMGSEQFERYSGNETAIINKFAISYISGTENCQVESGVAEENWSRAIDSSLQKQDCLYESLNISKDSGNNAEYAVLS